MLKLLEKTPSLSLSMKLSNTLRVIDSITFLVSITKIMKAYLLAEKKLFSHINQTEKVQDWLQISMNSVIGGAKYLIEDFNEKKKKISH